MAIRVALQHRTDYRYERRIEIGPQVVRLRPCVHTRSPVHSYSLTIIPSAHYRNWQQDPYGNLLARIVVPEPCDQFTVLVDLVVDLVVFNPFDFFIESGFQTWPFRYDDALAAQLQPYLTVAPATPLLDDLVARCQDPGCTTVDFLVAVNRQVHERIAYTIRLEPGVQEPEETLVRGSGSCRDSAWLLIQLLRRLGIATRFVSGYLIQLTPDREAVDGPSGSSADFCDLHAWCEAYIPGAGWIGLDATSGLLAGEGHIPLACAAEPLAAAPIEGAVEPCQVDFAHHMAVTRLDDAGRPGRPYDEDTWAAIDACGQTVEARSRAADLRLTVGGEPTVVSSRDPDAPEWNTDALGPTKAGLADRLLRRLAGHWAPGGLLQHGQGKWYPDEELPRWAFSCLSRRDGEALWHDPARFADPSVPGSDDAAAAADLLHRIAVELGLDEDLVMPAYEDPWYYSWRERCLPVNVDPFDSRLDDRRERERLVRVFRGGLGQPVGSVLPLAFRDGWVGGRWFRREGHCFLMPGDSPLGFRLPLDSLPWEDPEDREPTLPADPLAESAPLPPSHRSEMPATTEAERPPDPVTSASEPVRTALTVEVREGILRVFLPPVTDPAAFIALVAAVERAATAADRQLLIEGYPPPRHPDLQSFAVTPDPGVIEINVPPVADWSAQVDQLRTVYDACHRLHLAADKFDVDGRHTGTGGGCHVVLGGATPADSPWLRRPDLLGSLIRYLVNHPSLTYVFSGTFVGPTSQAPRIDEARQDAIAELELALDQLPDRTASTPPWLVDRLLRHLLVDLTGNTHRAEICIDKLFSPDSAAGRLGLVELRSFEMPPHWQLASAQNLLIRALLVAFWERPYRAPLTRWGTQLHDRWMLPRHLEGDLAEVCRDLRDRGLPLAEQWFAPHAAFRLPVLGSVVREGVEIELRQAIEPWHVLGEEATVGGQARYVDSSCERLQVLLRGATDRRHGLVCNGYRVPLRPTGVAGEWVAGIRYRAWQPPSCLHPTIEVDAPLQIDLYDDWHGRAVAGCVYHVVHPGGRSFETRPVNANEAEGRRCQRFVAGDHRPGAYRPQPAPQLPEAPWTLDLRRCPPRPVAGRRP